MRIRQIKVNSWRHFKDIQLDLDEDTSLVCIVGANGTGKSHLLELIAACAHRLGLAPGVEIPRGDPFRDEHDFSLNFYLAEGFNDAVEKKISACDGFHQWDRTLNISSKNSTDVSYSTVVAGGIEDDAQRANFTQTVVEALRQSTEVYFLSLDADRAYPKRNINYNDIAQAYEIEWETEEYTRGRSFRTTTTLYDEWIKYLLAQENQSGEKLMQGMRRAKKQRTPNPEFLDPFEGYAAALQEVLPHVLFTGVDSRKRTLLFDTTGLELTFNQLSGGEREIAFLVGQIDRFGLTHGLFLLDEPELHLNSDLIRAWVGYLTGTVQTGQIWLATHSLEAVEAAGQHATFVLERNEETRNVDGLARLDSRPVLSALSRAVGTPAFSISKLRFVFVEGEEGVGERERYRRLTGMSRDVRFIECGSCNEVIRRVAAVRALAIEGDIGIRIAGIVDRDFRTEEELGTLREDKGVYPLPVHEAENFFLHRRTLTMLLEQNGRGDLVATDLIREASDLRAGSWIFQHALSTRNARGLPEVSWAAKEKAKGLKWVDFDADRDACIQSILQRTGFDDDGQRQLKCILEVSVRAYERKRGRDDLWKVCEGKQVLNCIAGQVGYAGAAALEKATFVAWDRDACSVPREVIEFRQYVGAL